MKSITFRPLRRIKKTGKITVASYLQWRKVKTADYQKFNLIVDDEFKRFRNDEYVHNHKGELLYFYTYNPADVPVTNFIPIMDLWEDEIMDILEGQNERGPHGTRWDSGDVYYISKGMDCDGVPTLSHGTQDYLATHYNDVSAFEPLTVGMVRMWLGWFLYELKNSYLKIGK